MKYILNLIASLVVLFECGIIDGPVHVQLIQPSDLEYRSAFRLLGGPGGMICCS